MYKRIFGKATALVIVAVFIVATILSGCCNYTATDGTVSKTFPNCFKKAQDTACNPPAAVMAIVNMAAPLLATFLNLAVPGTALYVNAATAQEEIKILQTTGCLALTDLNKLVAYLQSTDFQQTQTMVASTQMAKGARASAPVDVQPLADWAQRFKK